MISEQSIGLLAPTGTPQAIIDKVHAAHPDAPLYLYESAGHGFNCDQRQDYNATVATQALQRTLAFFKQHLAG